MDFGLPGGDNRSFFSVSPSSSNSYFTEQALRAGFFGNEIRRVDFSMSADPLRDAIQRELEKERIREEIIAEEIMRRRELEMEVRRELAMERELAIQRGGDGGFGFRRGSLSPSLWQDPKLPPQRSVQTEVGSIDKLPFQRHCETAKGMEGGKGQTGQIMFLAKSASASVAGTKRKIAAVGAGELTLTGPKKKPHKEWSCALCKVSATSEQGLNDHLRGRKHKAREGELKANKTAEKQQGGSTSLEKKTDKPIKLVKSSGSPKQKLGKKQEAKAKQPGKKKTQDVKKKKFRYWCEDCHVGCHSQIVMASHMKGKKHMALLQAQRENGGCVRSATTLDDTTQGNYDPSGERNKGVTDDVDVEADGIKEAEEKGEVDGIEDAEAKGEVDGIEEAEEKGVEEQASIELEPPVGNKVAETETRKEQEDVLTDADVNTTEILIDEGSS